MSEILPALAFSLVIGAQFLAVIVAHGLRLDKLARPALQRASRRPRERTALATIDGAAHFPISTA